MRSKNSFHHSGFSLFEIAIVLVIIGLLTGAIVGGKSMIHQAELQTIVKDFTRYGDAYKKFVSQYDGKPGDLNTLSNKPTDIWGSAGGNGEDAACFTALGTAGNPATCNGDGNCRTDPITSACSCGNNKCGGANMIAGPYEAGFLKKPEEIYTAIQQLSNAKLIDGSYTGKRDATRGNIPGVNVPAGPIENSGYQYLTLQPITAANAADAPNYFHGNYGTILMFGNADVNELSELLPPADAFAIDSKIDDGLPAMGTMSTYFSYPSGVANRCVISTSGALTAASGRNAVYNSSVKGKFCNLIYVIDTK